MSIGAIVLVVLFAFLASFIQRLTGFGFGIVFMTVAPFVMPSYGEATALSGMLAIVCALGTGIRMFKFLPWKKLVGMNRFACNPESLPKRSDTESLAICRRFCNFAIGSNLRPKWPKIANNQPDTNAETQMFRGFRNRVQLN